MGNGGRFLIIWRWVCIPTAPDAFLAMGQGTESVRGIKISPEISLGNVACGHRSELQRQVLITTDDHVLSSMRPKYLEVFLAPQSACLRPELNCLGQKRGWNGQGRDLKCSPQFSFTQILKDFVSTRRNRESFRVPPIFVIP